MTNFQAAVKTFLNQQTTQGKGASLQHLLNMMRDSGWRGLGDVYHFEGELKNAGFKPTGKDVQYTRAGKAYGRKFKAVLA